MIPALNKEFLAALMSAALLSACGGSEETSDAADVVFTNARVYTVNADMPWAEAVAIKGDKIVYVGDTAGGESWAADSTRRLDLDGQLLLPGFIDSHVHPIAGGAYAKALSLNTYGSVDDWLAAIAAYAADNPELPVLFGYGFLATTFGPVGPTRELIDEVVPDRPAPIMDEGFHAAWANTDAAIEAYRDVMVILYSDVASAYVRIRTTQAQLEFARRNVALNERALELATKRVEAGVAAILDQHQAESNLAAVEAAIPPLETQLHQEPISRGQDTST